MHAAEGDPRRVVDGDVHVLPAGMPGVLLPIAGHPMPRTLETPEFLDVQVQQIPRMFVLLAIDGLRNSLKGGRRLGMGQHIPNRMFWHDA